jgi:hypothetical protein
VDRIVGSGGGEADRVSFLIRQPARQPSPILGAGEA